MAPRVTRRFPLEPLAEAVGVQKPQLAKLLGVRGRTWVEYRDLGVSEFVADRMACRLGLHPFVVWPELTEAQIVDASVVCADCPTRFIPRDSRHVYCSKRCRLRVQQRRWRATPKGREASRAANRRYDHSVRAYATEQQRRWRAANPEKLKAQRHRDYERRGAEVNRQRRERYATDDLYRARILAKQRERDRTKAAQRRREAA